MKWTVWWRRISAQDYVRYGSYDDQSTALATAAKIRASGYGAVACAEVVL